MAATNLPNPYLKTQVETASKEQLVVMLFDGIVRFSEQARKAILKNEIEDSHHNLMRAQAIIMELIYTVDREKGGEVAQNLLALHAYAFNCLIVANMKKEVEKIDEVQKIYRELREGWVGAMQNLGLSSTAAGTGAAPASPAAPAPAPVAKPAPAAPVATPVAAPVPTPAAPSGTYGPGKSAMPGPVSALPKIQGYGPGKTAQPTPATPGSGSQGGMISHQQQRSSQMLSSAYNNGKNIA